MSENSKQGHIVPLSVYFAVFGALMVLTATTVGVAYVDLGAFNLAVALATAITKATLVILFFMHVKYSGHMVKVYVVAGVLFVIIMIGITLSDYMTRGWIAIPRGWQ
jgi:cytochrome c oxidase subunit 4